MVLLGPRALDGASISATPNITLIPRWHLRTTLSNGGFRTCCVHVNFAPQRWVDLSHYHRSRCYLLARDRTGCNELASLFLLAMIRSVYSSPCCLTLGRPNGKLITFPPLNTVDTGGMDSRPHILVSSSSHSRRSTLLTREVWIADTTFS